jgi:hypothetical protein
LGNLSTPKSVQKLQRALHAKAKAEAGYRFYALYDKIYREDILTHAYAQCCSNKGAPGVDGQEFADVEAYGVQRWLGELALALREETYRPEPIRRVFIPKANGKLRPLGISTLRGAGDSPKKRRTSSVPMSSDTFVTYLPGRSHAQVTATSLGFRLKLALPPSAPNQIIPYRSISRTSNILPS